MMHLHIFQISKIKRCKNITYNKDLNLFQGTNQCQNNFFLRGKRDKKTIFGYVVKLTKNSIIPPRCGGDNCHLNKVSLLILTPGIVYSKCYYRLFSHSDSTFWQTIQVFSDLYKVRKHTVLGIKWKRQANGKDCSVSICFANLAFWKSHDLFCNSPVPP